MKKLILILFILTAFGTNCKAPNYISLPKRVVVSEKRPTFEQQLQTETSKLKVENSYIDSGIAELKANDNNR